eukprot:TRINITY_DN4747_c0_g3_i2.p1 TRINITY_DN4747_c0_g3~~TRINITY_DN4747_c0_g3_i2.p1  ORF type:complete len:608 (-),score=131.07 TRINITY_DN4747_c0_g3_i2:217-2040(-)
MHLSAGFVQHLGVLVAFCGICQGVHLPSHADTVGDGDAGAFQARAFQQQARQTDLSHPADTLNSVQGEAGRYPTRSQSQTAVGIEPVASELLPPVKTGSPAQRWQSLQRLQLPPLQTSGVLRERGLSQQPLLGNDGLLSSLSYDGTRGRTMAPDSVPDELIEPSQVQLSGQPGLELGGLQSSALASMGASDHSIQESEDRAYRQPAVEPEGQVPGNTAATPLQTAQEAQPSPQPAAAQVYQQPLTQAESPPADVGYSAPYEEYLPNGSSSPAASPPEEQAVWNTTTNSWNMTAGGKTAASRCSDSLQDGYVGSDCTLDTIGEAISRCQTILAAGSGDLGQAMADCQQGAGGDEVCCYCFGGSSSKERPRSRQELSKQPVYVREKPYSSKRRGGDEKPSKLKEGKDRGQRQPVAMDNIPQRSERPPSRSSPRKDATNDSRLGGMTGGTGDVDLVDDVKEELRTMGKGVLLLKVNEKWGSAEERLVTILVKTSTLLWGHPPGAFSALFRDDKELNLLSVKKVDYGSRSRVLTSSALAEAGPSRCLSLVTSDRAYDFICPDNETTQCFVLALSSCCKNATGRIRSRRAFQAKQADLQGARLAFVESAGAA